MCSKSSDFHTMEAQVRKSIQIFQKSKNSQIWNTSGPVYFDLHFHTQAVGKPQHVGSCLYWGPFSSWWSWISCTWSYSHRPLILRALVISHSAISTEARPAHREGEAPWKGCTEENFTFKRRSTLRCVRRHPHLHSEVIGALLVLSHFIQSRHQAFLQALGEVAETGIHTRRHKLKYWKEEQQSKPREWDLF